MVQIHPIRTFRENHEPRLTKAALARKIGVSKTTVGRWESGQRAIEPELLPKVAEATGISPQELRPDLAELFEVGE